MDQETIKELFIDHLRDIYDAEKQLLKALPKLAKAAESEELAEALNNHLEETGNQVTRLEQVFKIAGVPAKGKPCKGMKGLLDEGDDAIQEHEQGPVRDLAIIAGSQKVEHYEISAYGTARTFAEQLEMIEAIELLQQTEDEEKQADETLTDIAEAIFSQAGDGDEDDEEEAVEEEEPASSKRTASKPSTSGRSSAR
jgi:ferritin-like metal-binding protein YciE